MSEAAQLRIGELARRTGVATDLLRAWERRYGLLAPTRTETGYRLYSTADVAARTTDARAARAPASPQPKRRREALSEPVAGRTHGARVRVGGASARRSSGSTTRRRTPPSTGCSPTSRSTPSSTASVLPLLRELGDGWERGEVSIAQEHFASNLVRGRLLGLARGWDRGSGPRAVLACPPDERHDLGLLIFGLALREHGWRITFLGGDTPLETLAETVRQLDPDAVVLAVADRDRFERGRREAVAALSGETTMWCWTAPIRTPPSGPAPRCSTCRRSPRRRSSRRSRSRARARAGRRSSRGGGSAAPRAPLTRTAAGRGTPL